MEFDTKSLQALYQELEAHKSDMRCAYCGARASDREHVYPKIYFHQDGKPHLRYHLHINNLVWSCRECNLLSSDTAHQNFWDKKQYIRSRILKRYKRILAGKRWTIEEIEELHGKLKAHVFFMDKFHEQLLVRLENLDKPEICGQVEKAI